MKILTGTFGDKRGIEQIEIQTDGTSLATTIRGVEFTGGDFDSLTPGHETDQFDLYLGDLCGFELKLCMPVRLMAPEGLRYVDINAIILLGFPTTLGGLDAEDLRLHLAQPEFSLNSIGTSGYFENEMLSLAAQLPAGFYLQTCITCGLSDYSPAGSGSFGGLACFRDVPDEYRKVQSKDDIFALWSRMTEYVQESHYCPKFELRPKGAGYRG